MKTKIILTCLLSFLFLFSIAQKTITGTVYRDNKPAAGVTIEIHQGITSGFTDFDGKYKVITKGNPKWIKFIFLDETKKINITDINNIINFSFDGEIPIQESELTNINLKSLQEIVSDNDTEFISNFSIYNEFYKQNDYKSAIVPWRKIYEKYPKSTLNIYIHGINMYENFIENSNNNKELLDSLMKIYDRRIKFFNQKGFVLGRKGASWLKYNLLSTNNLSQEELSNIYVKGYSWLKESIKEEQEKSELSVLVLFLQTSKSNLNLQQISKEEFLKDYEIVINILDGINSDTENLNEIKSIIENIFLSSGAAVCESLIKIYSSQYSEKSNDVIFLKNMLRKLAKSDCDNSTLFFEASEKLYSLEPSPESAYNMARMFLKKEDTHKAKVYYKQAIAQESDNNILENYFYEYALLIFLKDHNYQESRVFARKVLSINPNNYKALMLIGDIYATSAKSFSDDEFQRSAVYWVAVDYFNKAKMSEEYSIEAFKKSNFYKNYFPNKESAFFLGIKEGDIYRIGGWINEDTKVRF